MRLTLLAIAAIFSGNLSAQPPALPNLEGMFFNQFDANGDGKVTEEEFLTPTQAQFAHMDANGDGSVDRDEVRTFTTTLQKRMMEMQGGGRR